MSVTGLLATKQRTWQFVMFPRSVAPALYDNVIQFCRGGGFSLTIAQEVAQSQTIISLVSAGLGLAIVPESMQGLRRAGVAYRPFREASPSVETVVAYNRDRISPAVGKFRQFGEKAPRPPMKRSLSHCLR
jgi:DNA-binding transcriptional LysR family regulator